MLKQGLSIQNITSATGLKAEEVKRLKKWYFQIQI
jgi:hypothetical protein